MSAVTEHGQTGALPLPAEHWQQDGTAMPRHSRQCDGSMTRRVAAIACSCLMTAIGEAAAAQVDDARAAAYFEEAAALCQHEGGRLWGVSLCGPMVFADVETGTIATNQPAPEAPRPRVLGYANAALTWGEDRWSTFVWKMIPADERARLRLLAHELFHRVQPGLGLFVATTGALPDHLDTVEGRYWLQLEWRALALRRTVFQLYQGASGMRRALFSFPIQALSLRVRAGG